MTCDSKLVLTLAAKEPSRRVFGGTSAAYDR